jgi:phosphopantetheinyl transferase
LQDLAFVPTEFGKPVLDCRLLPKRAKYIDFNVTDTQGLLAVAVACGVKAGLDLERLDRTLRFSSEQIARKKFSPAEQAQFLGMKPVSTADCLLPGNKERLP